MPRNELLFEIGVEELPAAFVTEGLRQLRAGLERELLACRLEVKIKENDLMGTPRRLAVVLGGLAERQPDVKEEVAGPPARVAFDDKGEPTKAAAGFAKKNGVELSALRKGPVEGKKGEYVLATREEVGLPTMEILPGLLKRVCEGFSWPKSMRWGAGDVAFARPVHWIVAMYQSHVVPFSFAGVQSGSASRGHRFLHSGEVKLEGSREQYLRALTAAKVIVEPAAREKMIRAELLRLKSESVHVIEDDELVLEVANLVEYPKAVCGRFDESFLEVPEQAIVSAMRSHQRYFATRRPGGELDNKFVTIAGSVARDPKVVRAGNERVLAARLSDAKFFFQEDQKKPLATWAEKLETVVFQAKLGTIAEKAKRIEKIAVWIGDRVAGSLESPVKKEDVVESAKLCKADLVTSMVYEFPDLQGVMGHQYALKSGADQNVARAIEEHYLPRGAGDRLPSKPLGSMLALADRIDTLVGCFAVGLVPTGSADPYGLRRAALGVLQILLGSSWGAVSIDDLLQFTKKAYDGKVEVKKEHLAELKTFLRTRYRGLLEGRDLSVDCIEAALASGFDDVVDAMARASSVTKLRQRPDFEPLASAFKRVANILKDKAVTEKPEPKRFVEAQEKALWAAFSKIEGRVEKHLGVKDYDEVLKVLAELKAPVDDFFESVMVMDKDEAIRRNRLALLTCINQTFARVADFRKLAV